ncbi:AbrB/MazE/SpoVT family DNA-binding domain-containing protein [Candidatus Woesearchaeota archaeon]|nr:AbrB/MazE/SpoVT family DNA-binding domain-containing protein [Candidatus Woesearchaeota archaeon]
MVLIPHVVQAGKRGQIVIPKELREKLGVEEADFDLYSVGDNGMLLKLRKDKGHK